MKFSGRFDTSGSMIALLVPEIKGGTPERHRGEEEGLGWGNSMSLIKIRALRMVSFVFGMGNTCMRWSN